MCHIIHDYSCFHFHMVPYAVIAILDGQITF